MPLYGVLKYTIIACMYLLVFTRHNGVHFPWSVRRTLMHRWKLVKPAIRPIQHSTVPLGRISGAVLCVTRHKLGHGRYRISEALQVLYSCMYMCLVVFISLAYFFKL